MIGVLYPYFICAYAVWTRPLLTKVGQCAQNFGDIKQWLLHTAKKSAVFCLWHSRTLFMTTPDDILAFWFPDGPDPEPDTNRRAVAGELDHWAATAGSARAANLVC